MTPSDISLPMLITMFERLERRVFAIEASIDVMPERRSRAASRPKQETRGEAASGVERHYTSREAAKLIGYTTSSLRNMRLENKGPRWIVTSSGTVRYPESALHEYLNGAKT